MRTFTGFGVDIGGSHVSAVAARSDGTVLASSVRARDPSGGARALLQEVEGAFGEVRGRSGLRSSTVGVAFPGVLEGPGGAVIFAPNMPEWLGRSARADLSRALGGGPWVENDANCAAWAEHCVGADAGQDLLYVVLGTGIGSGLVLDGELRRGTWGTAGEIGHTTVRGVERTCGCGNVGCLEALAGGRALALRALEIARAAPGSALGKAMRRGAAPDAWDLLRLAEEGDRACQRVREEAGVAIGRTLAGAVNLLGVPRVLLGGRLLYRAPGYEAAVRRGFREGLLPPVRHRVALRRARGWEHRNALGAMLLAHGNPR